MVTTAGGVGVAGETTVVVGVIGGLDVVVVAGVVSGV
jgi:hypothetical protein